jgi:TRAP-type uncharacterized transport system substrate-binding protein
MALAAAGALAAACSPQQFAEERGAKRRLSVATGGTGGVYYPYGGGVAKIISETVKNVEATAEVTSASVDNMKFLKDGKADLAFTLADTLADAHQGQGAFKDFGKVPAHALAVLYTNYTHVDALRDGKIDAFFWSGGLPTAAVLDLANTPRLRMKLLPNEDILPELRHRYGASLYYKVNVAKTAYAGLEADVPVVGVANLLVVHQKMPEGLAYDITKALFDRQAELASIHPEAKNLARETAAVGSPVPFHNGAIRYFLEQKVWQK